MGNTSVKTAWSPRFLRLDCGTSACKNSLYELVCNSMRFGGAMISLILPKLIRSVTRDDIFTFSLPANSAGLLFSINDTRQKRRVHSELADSFRFRGYGVEKLIILLKNVGLVQRRNRSGAFKRRPG